MCSHAGPAWTLREGGAFWEIPVSTIGIFGQTVPLGSGEVQRQLPQTAVRYLIDRWTPRRSTPLVLSFALWEFDPDQPVIAAAAYRNRRRQYKNLPMMEPWLAHLLDRHAFGSVAQWLHLPQQAGERAPTSPATGRPIEVGTPRRPSPVAVAPAARDPVRDPVREPLTIIIPCFNELAGLAYLETALGEVRLALGRHFDVRVLFIDDGSTDGTPDDLDRRFAAQPGMRVVRHATNVGIAGAVMTGLRAAETELVCCIDADCSYDPLQLVELLEAMAPDVDLVTASPYHQKGLVTNVPAYRLFMSRSLSRLYRLFLRHRLATYTSCFRVYRRRAALTVPLRNAGFIGIAEILVRLDRQGARIVEVPATLQPRLLGSSKMKMARTIAGHLKLLAELAFRVRGMRPQPPQPVPPSGLVPDRGA